MIDAPGETIGSPEQISAIAAKPSLAAPEPSATARRELVVGMQETTVAADATDASPSYVSEAVMACQQSWDPSTHMTQDEWTQSCQRVEVRDADTAGDGSRAGIEVDRW